MFDHYSTSNLLLIFSPQFSSNYSQVSHKYKQGLNSEKTFLQNNDYREYRNTVYPVLAELLAGGQPLCAVYNL